VVAVAVGEAANLEPLERLHRVLLEAVEQSVQMMAAEAVVALAAQEQLESVVLHQLQLVALVVLELYLLSLGRTHTMQVVVEVEPMLLQEVGLEVRVVAETVTT
jgi:hypothetical protein